MTEKLITASSEDLEHVILVVAPEQEMLDWICYRAHGGVEPSSDGAAEHVPEAGKRPRPEREDVIRALGHLVNLGMLTYDRGRWSMTAKGFAAI